MFVNDSLSHHLRGLEESLFELDFHSSEHVSQILLDNFVEIGSSGRIYTKQQIIASLRSEVPIKITAYEFRLFLLAPTVVLVTYRACRHTEPPVYTLRSSIWRQQGEQWKMAFHQGTLTLTNDSEL